MALTYPDNPFVDGDLIPASRWNGRWTAIQQKFGNIVNDDIATGADITGSKIAANSMPGDRVAAKTLAQAQLALQSVGNPEIIDGTIQKGKLSTTAGQRIAQAQVEILTQSAAYSGSGVGTIYASITTPIPVATYQILGVRLSNAPTHGVGSALTLFTTTVSGNYAVGIDQSNPGGAFSGNVEIVYIAKT